MRFTFSICIGLGTLMMTPVSYAKDVDGPSPQQISTVDTICTKVVGLRRGETYFAGCREVLTQSLLRKVANNAVAMASRACSQRGFAVGSAAFSTCVLDSENDPALSINDGTGTTYSDENAPTIESFYNVPFSVRWNRERHACAALGLTPNSGAFDECVSGLDGSFLPDPN